MTYQQHFEWFDKQIAECQSLIQRKELGDDVRTWQYGKLNGLWESKNRFAIFIALKEPSQLNETKEFTEGL